MKKIFKKEIGITLVALIITIVILLILAGITIGQLTGNGIFESAKEAKEKYENSAEKEQGILADYENAIVTGNTRETVTIDKAEYERLQKKPVLISRGMEEADVTISGWTTLEQISLSGNGHGKAIISYSLSSGGKAKTSISGAITMKEYDGSDDFEVTINDESIAIDSEYYPTSTNAVWLTSSMTGTIEYDENTVIGLCAIGGDYKPLYQYSILLFPE